MYINISKCYTNIHSLYKQLTKMGLTNLHLFCFYTLLHYTSNTSLDSSHTSTNSSHTRTDTMLYSNWMLNNHCHPTDVSTTVCRYHPCVSIFMYLTRIQVFIEWLNDIALYKKWRFDHYMNLLYFCNLKLYCASP